MSRTVYVVMGNDFPDSVFSDKKEANEYVDSKNKENEDQRRRGYGRIYWRVYPFVEDERLEKEKRS